MTDLKEMTDPRVTDLRTRDSRLTDLRVSVPQEIIVSRTTETAITGTTEEVIRAAQDRRERDRIAVSSSQEEAIQVATLRETDRTDFREMADRALKAARVIAVVLALVRAITGALTVRHAITEEMVDRELDSEIKIRVRDLQEKLRQRIWRSGARMKRDAQAAWRRTNAPRRIISMKTMRL